MRFYVGETRRSLGSEARKQEHLRTGRVREDDEVFVVGVPDDRKDRIESWAIAKFGSYENERDRPGGPLSPGHEIYTLTDRVVGFVKDRKERRKIRDFVESQRDD